MSFSPTFERLVIRHRNGKITRAKDVTAKTKSGGGSLTVSLQAISLSSPLEEFVDEGLAGLLIGARVEKLLVDLARQRQADVPASCH
jgi:hypothetical protein